MNPRAASTAQRAVNKACGARERTGVEGERPTSMRMWDLATAVIVVHVAAQPVSTICVGVARGSDLTTAAVIVTAATAAEDQEPYRRYPTQGHCHDSGWQVARITLRWCDKLPQLTQGVFAATTSKRRTDSERRGEHGYLVDEWRPEHEDNGDRGVLARARSAFRVRPCMRRSRGKVCSAPTMRAIAGQLCQVPMASWISGLTSTVPAP